MKPLSVRKNELLAACEIQRQMIGLEWGLVQLHFYRLQGAVQRIPKAWKWAAPLLGFIMARGLRRTPRRAGWIPPKWVILSALWQGWRLWRKR